MYVSTIFSILEDRQLGLAVVCSRNLKQSNREKRVKINKGFTVHSAIRLQWLHFIIIFLAEVIWHSAHSINRNPVYSTPPLSSFLVVGKSIDHRTLWKMMPHVKLLKIQSLCLSPPTSYFFAFIY